MNFISRSLTVLAAASILVAGGPTRSDAGQIEQPRIKVVYVEDVPTERYPNRAYFETNDGATFRYINFARCAKDNAVPDRVCRTVFFYAR